MKNLLLILTCLLISKTVFAFEDSGTREMPYLLECGSCYTDFDFTSMAKQNTGTNQTSYFLVFNLNSSTLKTVYSFSNWEPELGISMKRASIVSTLSNHQDDFNEHLEWIANDSLEKTESIDYPSSGHYSSCCFMNDAGAIADYGRYIRSQLQQNDAWYASKTFTVQLNFPNGDKAFLLILPLSTATQLIAALSQSDTIITQSGGSGGGSVGSTVTSGTVWNITSGSNISWTCVYSGNTLTCTKNT